MNGDMIDVVHPDGTHDYWSTHCRHGNHEACSATELAPGVARRPSQCKTCAAPCRCSCHQSGQCAGAVYDQSLSAPERCALEAGHEGTCEP